eukprot:7439510-Alexandrium_andersonii.AAC.1
MSASLVGSEMCIRDSFGGVRGGGSPPGEGKQETAESGVKPPLCTYRCACLLYTSDAADDM